MLAVPLEAFRRVIAIQPLLSNKILVAFMARRAELLRGAAVATRVIGSRYSAQSLQLREFLTRSRLPHEWLDPDHDPQVDELLRRFGVPPSELPVVISSGTVLRRPSPGELAEYLGLTLGRLPERCFDLVVVGGGPAGLAAAVYGASEGLRTLALDMVAPGGQAGSSSRIENYFGFPTGISGGRPDRTWARPGGEVRSSTERAVRRRSPPRRSRPPRHRTVRRHHRGRESGDRGPPAPATEGSMSTGCPSSKTEAFITPPPTWRPNCAPATPS